MTDSNWRKRPKFWTDRRLEELADLIDHGWSDEQVGRHFGKSAVAIQLARRRHGIRPRSGYNLSARAVAAMLGVSCSKTVARWIRSGWLRGRRGQVWGTHQQWYVTRGSLLDFLANPAYWHLWEPDRIPDPALRYHYRSQRTERYLTHAEVAARYYVETQTVGAWIDRGLLPAVRRGNRLVPEKALQDFRPPSWVSKAGMRRRPWTDEEDGRLSRMREQGWTYRQCSDALGRPVTSVSNRWHRLRQLRERQAA